MSRIRRENPATWVIGRRVALGLCLLIAAGGCQPADNDAIGDVGALSEMPLPSDVDQSIDVDVEQLRSIAGGLTQQQESDQAFVTSLREATDEQSRSYYEPAEERQLRQRFGKWLEHRRSLLQIAQRYGNWGQAKTGELRRRCLLIAAAATVTASELDATVADVFADRMAQRRCNETRGEVPLPADAFDLVALSAADEENGQLCRNLVDRIEAMEADSPTTDSRDRWLVGRIRKAWAQRQSRADAVAAVARDIQRFRAGERATEGAIQSQWAVSQVIASVVVPRERCIELSHVRQAQGRLQPGDLMFRHRYGRLSNFVIPGFWTHSAVYLGKEADLLALGLELPPQIVAGLRAGLPEDAYVIEGVGEGVVVNRLQVNMDCDDVVAFRPRLTKEQRVTFIGRTFDYLGCDYDYDFDIATADKLTCVELIWRCVGDMIPLQPMETVGRDMLLPNDVVHEFLAEIDSEDRRTDFVMLLISDSPRSPARFGDVTEVP
jgi:hypothetical protein